MINSGSLTRIFFIQFYFEDMASALKDAIFTKCQYLLGLRMINNSFAPDKSLLGGT
jgi:hypothetical protein